MERLNSVHRAPDRKLASGTACLLSGSRRQQPSPPWRILTHNCHRAGAHRSCCNTAKPKAKAKYAATSAVCRYSRQAWQLSPGPRPFSSASPADASPTPTNYQRRAAISDCAKRASASAAKSHTGLMQPNGKQACCNWKTARPHLLNLACRYSTFDINFG